VNEVYEDKEAMLQGARALCEKIAANSPLAVQGSKHILRYAEDHTLSDTLDYIGNTRQSQFAY
jgi:enoyl-CoA hydratase